MKCSKLKILKVLLNSLAFKYMIIVHKTFPSLDVTG